MLNLKFPWILAAFYLYTFNLRAQEPGLQQINADSLRSAVNFLASSNLKGRKTGEEGNNAAAQYLAAKSVSLGLKPLPGNNSFFQPFKLVRTSLVHDSCQLDIHSISKLSSLFSSSIIVTPLPSASLNIEGSVVFAGYGINSLEDNYFDLKSIDVKDKLLLIMDRAPSSADGKKGLLKDEKWMTPATLDTKFFNLVSYRPKAILLVLDPKSGFKNIDDVMPGAIQDLSEEYSIAGNTSLDELYISSLPKIIIISTEMADSILKPLGENLRDIQKQIDTELKPHTMEIPGITLSLKIVVKQEDLNSSNVAAIVEAPDSAGRKDALIYTAHFDHIGMDQQGNVNYGADDNASGTAALLEIARAFKNEQKKLKNSVIFLWTSGEELGLMGSKYYTENPLFPLDNTLADINLDMIGRSWTPGDTGIIRGEKLDVKKGDSIFVAGGKNCQQILTLSENAAKQLNMQSDYSYNSPNDTKKMYYRSDHYNFALKHIPAIFYTTGIHKDYHSPGDIPSKLDFSKMLKISKLAYLLGFKIVAEQTKLINN